MRLILNIMIKNESRILKRCLEALEGVVDAFCIHDTGSTDNSREIAKEFLETRRGCVTESEWKNFGHNRSLSFQAARDYVRDVLQWTLEETYALLLDADMVFVPNKLREQTLTETGYTIVQCAGALEYPNCRLVRMDFNWACVGVTHEYWNGPTQPLSKDVCWIDDRNDGGCKSDKFERDARLLEEGLKEDPTNVRYMFYLAQTYNSLKRFEDAIQMYKKRIAAGGWEEEVWYSHYMIGQSYHALEDPIRFEAWMLRAHKRRPTRAEPIYKLTRYFRETSQHYKAYHYAKLGKSISRPGDSLFIEKDVYEKLFDYEMTILTYYISPDRTDGLRKSMKYLLERDEQNVINNMEFYTSPIVIHPTHHPVLRDAWGLDYHPTSVSMFTYKGEPYQNVRFVNYVINHKTGSYEMKENGVYSSNHKVRTQNLCFSPKKVVKMKDDSITLPRHDSRIRGLEDIRVYENASGKLCFVATTSEYTDNIRIMNGCYDVETGSYSDCVIMESPFNHHCEKNWLPINKTDLIIYSWNPYRLGKRVENKLEIQTTHTTPAFFSHLRGSAIPIRVGNDLWALTHFVHYTMPRKYFHCFVKLDGSSYLPVAISLPFVFRTVGIEYCIGCQVKNERIEFVFSSWDDVPMYTDIAISDVEWLDI